MRTLKLTLAYDGTNYVGWQRQANGTAIQQVVEDAFLPLVGDDCAPGVAGAGRTDAGVHALGQVASVNIDVDYAPSVVQRALNIRLPPDIRVVTTEEAPLGFHARFHAQAKSYRYRLARAPVLLPFERSFVWHVPGLRDVDAMRQALAPLVGRRDFASFQSGGSATRDTVRTIERLEIRDDGDEVTLDIDGDGFLRHMVRIIVGTLVEVGCGLRAAGTVAAIVEARDRRAAGPTAPPCGLTLMAVRY
jgi:tRNA pseudouridine38-40 synthase